jgi:hypothetical protein
VSKPFAAVLAAVLAGLSAFVLPARPVLEASAPLLALQTDLDAFMQKVVARRDENWKRLQQYILDEREQIDLKTASLAPIWGERREYSWFLREGYFVRSPTKVNGVTVSEAERRQYEDEYLKRVKERDRRRGRGPGAAMGAPADNGAVLTPAPPTGSPDNLIVQVRQPEFIDSAYFLRFKFEQAKYALVGHETLEGRDALRIEYYPARLFSHEQDQQQRRQQQQRTDRDQDFAATIERLMNQLSLVTIWVDPKSYQILKYTFDSVGDGLDFLPAASLFRVDGMKASMTMSQPFPDVWLPRDVDMGISATTALGAFGIHYRLEYHDYREAKTSSRIKRGGSGDRR